MIDLAALKSAALAATPGPWAVQGDGWTVRVEQPDTERERGWRICYTYNSGPHRVEQQVNDAHYISLADPQTVIALVRIARAAVACVNNTAWAGVCDEDVALETELREAGLL